MIRLCVSPLCLLLLAGCDQASEPARPRPVPSVASKPVVAASPLGEGDLGRVCRAAIGTLNGRDPAIIEVARVKGGVADVQYLRPDDGKLWKYRCRAESSRILWAGVDVAGPGTGPGRWRDRPEDEVMTFALAGRSITIVTRYDDGSINQKVYEIEPS